MMVNFFRLLRSKWLHLGLGILISIPFFISNFRILTEHLNTTFDDAYMFYRYAENFLNGYGVAWNPDGVQTYGVTSLLYLFLIVGVTWAFSSIGSGPTLVITSFAMGMLTISVLVVWALKTNMSKTVKKYRFLFVSLVMVILLSSKIYLLHSTSGMDTTLAILNTTLMVITAVKWVQTPKIQNLILLVLSAYASFLTRPDLLLYTLLFPIFYGCFFLEEDRNKNTFRFIVVISSILLLDTLIKYLIFGNPLPLPFYAKSMGFYDGYKGMPMWNPMTYLFQFFRLVFPFITIMIFSVTTKNWKLAFAFFSPVLFTFLYFFSMVQVMGFWARYYIPALPFFIIGSLLIFNQRAEETESSTRSKMILRGAVTFITFLLLFVPFVQSSMEKLYETRLMPPVKIYKSVLSQTIVDEIPYMSWRRSIEAMARMCSQLPSGTVVAMSEYGLVGANAPQIQILDLLGLHDPFFAHNGFSTAELFRRTPDLIWLPPPDYSKIYSSIQDDPNFLSDYDYYPGVFNTGLAVRRDSAHYERIMDILQTLWRDYYPNMKLPHILDK